MLSYHGHLYLTDSYICFNSNILGVQKKIKCTISEIVEVSKAKVLGIFNSGILIKT